jgi:tetratricopeptide (TPR) repeat protein
MKRYDEALADLSHALELKPNYELVIALRGITYRQMERYNDALADLSRAIELKQITSGDRQSWGDLSTNEALRGRLGRPFPCH